MALNKDISYKVTNTFNQDIEIVLFTSEGDPNNQANAKTKYEWDLATETIFNTTIISVQARRTNNPTFLTYTVDNPSGEITSFQTAVDLLNTLNLGFFNLDTNGTTIYTINDGFVFGEVDFIFEENYTIDSFTEEAYDYFDPLGITSLVTFIANYKDVINHAMFNQFGFLANVRANGWGCAYLLDAGAITSATKNLGGSFITVQDNVGVYAVTDYTNVALTQASPINVGTKATLLLNIDSILAGASYETLPALVIVGNTFVYVLSGLAWVSLDSAELLSSTYLTSSSGGSFLGIDDLPIAYGIKYPNISNIIGNTFLSGQSLSFKKKVLPATMDFTFGDWSDGNFLIHTVGDTTLQSVIVNMDWKTLTGGFINQGGDGNLALEFTESGVGSVTVNMLSEFNSLWNTPTLLTSNANAIFSITGGGNTILLLQDLITPVQLPFASILLDTLEVTYLPNFGKLGGVTSVGGAYNMNVDLTNMSVQSQPNSFWSDAFAKLGESAYQYLENELNIVGIIQANGDLNGSIAISGKGKIGYDRLIEKGLTVNSTFPATTETTFSAIVPTGIADMQLNITSIWDDKEWVLNANSIGSLDALLVAFDTVNTYTMVGGSYSENEINFTLSQVAQSIGIELSNSLSNAEMITSFISGQVALENLILRDFTIANEDYFDLSNYTRPTATSYLARFSNFSETKKNAIKFNLTESVIAGYKGVAGLVFNSGNLLWDIVEPNTYYTNTNGDKISCMGLGSYLASANYSTLSGGINIPEINAPKMSGNGGAVYFSSMTLKLPENNTTYLSIGGENGGYYFDNTWLFGRLEVNSTSFTDNSIDRIGVILCNETSLNTVYDVNFNNNTGVRYFGVPTDGLLNPFTNLTILTITNNIDLEEVYNPYGVITTFTFTNNPLVNNLTILLTATQSAIADALLIEMNSYGTFNGYISFVTTGVLGVTPTVGVSGSAYDSLISRGWTIISNIPLSGFEFSVNTANAGTSGATQFALPLVASFNGITSIVDWGDGTSDVITAFNQAEVTHTYGVAGIYNISISGALRGFQFNNGSDKSKITNIFNWGIFEMNENSSFFGCNNLNTSATDSPLISTIDLSDTFSQCTSLTTLDVSTWDTSNVITMDGVFSNCTSLTTLNVSTWGTSNVTNMSALFFACRVLTTLDLSTWDTSSVTNMSSMFSACTDLVTLNVSNLNMSSVTNMSNMFNSCQKLLSLDLSVWDTSSVTNMSVMFNSCFELLSLDVSTWNTSSVTNMSGMFGNCRELTTLDVSAWDTSGVIGSGIISMFANSILLTSLDLSAWDTSGVDDMRFMFINCNSLATLDVSTWDTSGVTTMVNMFFNCTSLTTLDVSSWDTSSVTNMSVMFKGCTLLTTLDVSTWDTSSVTNMSVMFLNCTSLATLNVSTWDITTVTNFNGFMLNSVGMTTPIYDATLVNFAGQNPNNNLSPNFGGSQYTIGGAGETARTQLITTDLWTIVDGGGI